MSDLLGRLYRGQLCPEDSPVDSQQYQQAAADASILQNRLLEALSPPHLSLFQQYLQASYEMEQALSLHSFASGFRLGIGLMEEARQED